MVEVEFPDGSVREVPSRRREVKGAPPANGLRPTVVFEEPCPDPAWRFRPLGEGRWFADPRGPC